MNVLPIWNSISCTEVSPPSLRQGHPGQGRMDLGPHNRLKSLPCFQDNLLARPILRVPVQVRCSLRGHRLSSQSHNFPIGRAHPQMVGWWGFLPRIVVVISR